MDVREEVAEINFEALFADGFDEAVIGVDTYGRVVYDYDKCVDILMDEDDGLEYIDAIEHMDYNVTGAYVGEYTPIFIKRIENLN